MIYSLFYGHFLLEGSRPESSSVTIQMKPSEQYFFYTFWCCVLYCTEWLQWNLDLTNLYITRSSV